MSPTWFQCLLLDKEQLSLRAQRVGLHRSKNSWRVVVFFEALLFSVLTLFLNEFVHLFKSSCGYMLEVGQRFIHILVDSL